MGYLQSVLSECSILEGKSVAEAAGLSPKSLSHATSFPFAFLRSHLKVFLVQLQDPALRRAASRDALLRREERDCDDILAATQDEAVQPVAPADLAAPANPFAGAPLHPVAQ